ncbi:MAG: hypothetical protein A3H59_01880 [Candidatus Jacksonbacteria bacterium RIFCSPLOWO2_02_FULL_43_9]|nr:MAG: hypothetical protein UV70_C0005G0013 [Parcubacteria group bacterium GW2011_GWA2_43_13]OGY69892.1 MAG: hypothetical protein A3B94_02760 [Candidatus Jacksonbacteria bacterium RIFCSPHIGHO2_02_FULL_43_10]OGY71273.1 MAG: hypothetical protein A2986_04180 [Candidatus Jacksonbacteria bacterium RIFCSPLOWO2_01_FULL_44_13]OGY73365.1 MAG: hypothetical protein A3H59_01880 [Candidatus Jacksonbacteria bacterium RIFCSPLOWO2_02_FULL_43_9]HAZ17130.1 hypothetical protein [Candidatus Jacksonbacteria bacter
MACVLAMCGVPCSGKTSLGRILEQRMGWLFLDIDEIARQNGLQLIIDPSNSADATLRDRIRMDNVYDLLHIRVARELNRGISAIVVATYSRRERFNALQENVAIAGGELKVVRCVFTITDEEVQRRLELRDGDGGCVTIAHVRDVVNRFEDIVYPQLTVNTDTTESVDTIVDTILEYMKVQR